MSADLPKIISLQHFHFNEKDIYVAEPERELPFDIKRVYWITQTNQHLEVGNHAHVKLSQVFVAVHGQIEVSLTNRLGDTEVFDLNEPQQGLYVPPMYWKKLRFLNDAVLLCLTSHAYDTEDYILDFEEFLLTKD